MNEKKMQGINPYLPSWEYIPDGEPYVFNDRVYIYGSHDIFDGHVFCLGDYVCWSAPVDDLGNWTYEGVIYGKTDDPLNKDGRMCLYAPDVVQGPDGRYYIYYVYDKVSVVSVAVCDTPAGKYEFLGYVHYKDGTKLGDREGDEPQFDPGVIREGDKTYLYTGFCPRGDKSRSGSFCFVLGPDMLTIEEDGVLVAPGIMNPDHGSFEGHEFFEASSIRKRGNTYYFIYSSIWMHELCYATSDSPQGPFTYKGVIVSNCDHGIGTYKDAEFPTMYGANNHGSIVEIAGEWYIFYHRHTNGNWYSRQGCAEIIHFTEDGEIPQVEITSQGLNAAPLIGKGEHMAYTACNLFTEGEPHMYVGDPGEPMIKQRLDEGMDKPEPFISGIKDKTFIGFKYYDCKGITKVSIKVRGYGDGVFEVRTGIDSPVLAEMKVENTNIWTEYSSDIELADGTYAIYISYKGSGSLQMLSFSLD
ncbi:MAG: family 43 glycosylhydrolase [Eubacterium sp.]|nr:family 43 glycosylhydrolase [Eubacterium sp.]